MNDFAKQNENICQILQRIATAKTEIAGVLTSSNWRDWPSGLTVGQIMALRRMADQVEKLVGDCFDTSLDTLAPDAVVQPGVVAFWLPVLVRHAFVDINSDRLRLALAEFTKDQSGHRPHGCLEAAAFMRDNPARYRFWIDEGFRVLNEDFRTNACPLDEEQALDCQCGMLETYAAEYEQFVAIMVERRWRKEVAR